MIGAGIPMVWSPFLCGNEARAAALPSAHDCCKQRCDAEESENAAEDQDAAISGCDAGERKDRVLIEPKVLDVHVARENGVQQGDDRVEACCQKGDSDDYESSHCAPVVEGDEVNLGARFEAQHGF